ncbi:MAG: ATP-binding protein [Candidatus Pacearchaeota archaeon]|nr:ATP-binding protein [Candidatus Pacearchaeota archaeon]
MTNWLRARYILTGGPGCGKSSVLLAAELQGGAIIREAAEDFIRLQQARGIAKPWEEADFQDKILELQLERERFADKIGLRRVLLDRGTLDGLAYYQIQGRKPSKMIKVEMEKHRARKPHKPYELVFLIENLGDCQRTEVRREDLKEALELERLQEQNYRDFGYDVVRIPAGKVDERAREILKYTESW